MGANNSSASNKPPAPSATLAPEATVAPASPVKSTTHLVRNLWYAAKMGDVDLLRTLIDVEGHCFHEQDSQLNTPFYYACTCDHPLVLQYLHGLYVQHNVEMPAAQRLLTSRSCASDDVRAFVDGKVTIDHVIATRAKEAREATMTQWDAAKEGNLSKLRQLILHTPHAMADLDESQRSALFYAAASGHAAAVAMLLEPFKKAAAATPDQAAAHIEVCRRAVTNENVLHALNGTISLKEIMIQGKKAKRAGPN